MPPRLAWTLPLLVLTVPSALACSLAPLEDNSRLVWTDGERVMANRQWKYGWHDLETRRWTQVVEPFALSAPALSPDGRWMAWQESSGLGADCSATGGVTYAQGPDGEREVVYQGPVQTYAAGPEWLALAPHRAPRLLLMRWGEWDAPREVGLDADHVGWLRASPDGRWFAAHLPLDGRLLLIDAEGARVAAAIDVKDGVFGLAFSPASTRLAVFSGQYQQPGTLRILEVPTLRPLAQNATASTGFGLAWGERGLAYAMHEPIPHVDGAEPSTTYQVVSPEDFTMRASVTFRNERGEGGPLWTPDGRLLVGVGGHLRVLDQELGERPARVEEPPVVEPTVRAPDAPPTDPQRRVPLPGVPLVLAALALGLARRVVRR